MGTLRRTEPEVHQRPESEWAAAEETWAGDCCRTCGHRGHRAEACTAVPELAKGTEG